MNPFTETETPTSESTGTITAVDPASGDELAAYPATTPAELDTLLAAAADARDDAGWRTATARVAFLTGIADRLRDATDEIVGLAAAETGLSRARLEGEVERTWRQALRFAEVAGSDAVHAAIVDPADPGARPVPRPDLRRLDVPLGPVAVFSASNFPVAFSVAGGDTVSALAAGCPVIVKAHPGHPGTSAFVGRLVAAAADEAGLAPGWFGLVQSASIPLATELVRDDRIEAVGFTGSIPGGRAIYDVAARRSRPIPVFAEMGSVNPVVVTAAAAGERAEAIGKLVGGAVVRDAGQLCTKPGLVLVPESPDGDRVVDAVGDAVSGAATVPMLGPRLRDGARTSLDALAAADEVTELGRSPEPPDGAFAVPATALQTTAAALRADPSLADERFGPIVLVVRYADVDDLLSALDVLPGQLTGTVHLGAEAAEDRMAASAITDRLLRRVGRIVFDGVSTGVVVGDAQFHGGPYPATTASATTSVGTLAVRRFLRPVAFQNAPAWLLPQPLRD